MICRTKKIGFGQTFIAPLMTRFLRKICILSICMHGFDCDIVCHGVLSTSTDIFLFHLNVNGELAL